MLATRTRENIAPNSFLTSALNGVSVLLHSLAALCPEERTTGTHWTGGCVGLNAGLDTDARGKILCLCQRSNPGHLVVQSVVRHYTDDLFQLLGKILRTHNYHQPLMV
jgi:hypothetical protein